MHAPSIARQFRQTGHALDDDGQAWVTIVPTGQSRTTCPCGADTGMIADADALAAYRTHQDGGDHAQNSPGDDVVPQADASLRSRPGHRG